MAMGAIRHGIRAWVRVGSFSRAGRAATPIAKTIVQRPTHMVCDGHHIHMKFFGSLATTAVVRQFDVTPGDRPLLDLRIDEAGIVLERKELSDGPKGAVCSRVGADRSRRNGHGKTVRRE